MICIITFLSHTISAIMAFIKILLILNFVLFLQHTALFMACTGNVSWFKASAPKMSWAGIAADFTGQYLAAVSCCNTSGYRGPIYASSNYGVNWKKTSAPYYNYFRIATSFNSTYYYAVSNNGGGSDGYLILSSDGGQTWSKCTTIENGDSLGFQYVSCDRTGQYVVATTGNSLDGNTGIYIW